MAVKKDKSVDALTKEEVNKFKEMTKNIVNLFHDENFSPFEAFLVLEGVKQNIQTDIIYRTVESVAKGPHNDLFFEGSVDGPYK